MALTINGLSMDDIEKVVRRPPRRRGSTSIVARAPPGSARAPIAPEPGSETVQSDRTLVPTVRGATLI